MTNRGRSLKAKDRRNHESPEPFKRQLILLLREHAKNSPDAGFAGFVKNVVEVIQHKSAGLALKKRDSQGNSPSSRWRPAEESSLESLLKLLRAAFIANGVSGVISQLKYSYSGIRAGQNFSQTVLRDQGKISDLRFPIEWYPATREIRRKIILHVGPTNSGKTYHALKRLEQAETGIYAGPLRLLAHEVYSRLNAKGRMCDLVTGDERLMQDNAVLKSCTVEMVPLNDDVDVAVIDEIQMIGHRERGWAWTQALLGLKAKELHLCGEERSVPLIRELVAATGDHFEVRGYERLSPLETMSTSLSGDFSALRKGDCLVVFSRIAIHALKGIIEKTTNKRVAVVYGSLPPEVRSQQAKLFNDPDNDYDILVASDAIGMGLNLAIKRIIFESIYKYNGNVMELIPAAQIRQIAGRAGRYRTATQDSDFHDPANGRDTDNEVSKFHLPSQNSGLVTTLYPTHLLHLRKAMNGEMDPIMSAGIFPPSHIVTKFATYFSSSTTFSYILLRLHELSVQHPRFHLCDLRDQIPTAEAIQSVSGLTIDDRIIFCSAPTSIKHDGMTRIVTALAECVGSGVSGALLDIPALPLDILDAPVSAGRGYLDRLELLHKSLILYLWLSYRFAGVFTTQTMAFYVKRLTEERIQSRLSDYSANRNIQNKIQRLRGMNLNGKLNSYSPEENASLEDGQADQLLSAQLKDDKTLVEGNFAYQN